MALSNTEYGKAYEYACLVALKEQLLNQTEENITVLESDAYNTAQTAYEKAAKEGMGESLLLAAQAAARVVIRLEPQLEYGSGTLTLVIQTDAQGINGDVRDVVCIRNANGWEIGLSCKHNHHAVKHSRLSATIDFGAEWLGFPCSQEYFDTVTPIFNELRHMRESAMVNGEPLPLWNDIPDKADRYYLPILRAFLKELKNLAQNCDEVPSRLIKYLLGRHDFYKVITDDRRRTTRVEAINIAGTLNQAVKGHRSIVDTAKLKLPTRFYHMDFVPNSDNKLEIVCDEGWALTMRIHNASSKIEPSLKFDVRLISLPSSVHAQVEPW